MFEFWSDQLVPWLTLICIGVYMLFGSLEVLAGNTTVGTFVATINIYKDLGDRFRRVHNLLDKAKNAEKPLLDLTHRLNLPTCQAQRHSVNASRLTFATDKCKESDSVSWNSVPITLQNVQYLARVKVTPCLGSPPFDLRIFGTSGCPWYP